MFFRMRSTYQTVFGRVLPYSLFVLAIVLMLSLVMGGAQARTKGISVSEEVFQAFAKQFFAFQVLDPPRVVTKDVSFVGRNGKRFYARNFRGNFSIVNLGASWCAPCIEELPSLEQVKKRYTNTIEVVAVSVEKNKSRNEIIKFLKNKGIGEFAAYQDDHGVLKRGLKYDNLPSTYLIDPKGNILYVFEGNIEWESPESEAFLQALSKQ